MARLLIEEGNARMSSWYARRFERLGRVWTAVPEVHKIREVETGCKPKPNVKIVGKLPNSRYALLI